MLTEIYIEALLVDEELADQVWKAWIGGEIDDSAAIMMWRRIATRTLCRSGFSLHLMAWLGKTNTNSEKELGYLRGFTLMKRFKTNGITLGLCD